MYILRSASNFHSNTTVNAKVNHCLLIGIMKIEHNSTLKDVLELL